MSGVEPDDFPHRGNFISAAPAADDVDYREIHGQLALFAFTDLRRSPAGRAEEECVRD
jgi:hypothetical protein